MRAVLLLMLFAVGAVRGYPGGAPKEQCQSMEPNHGDNNADQDVVIKVEPHQSCYKASTDIMVKVSPPRNTKIEGFLAIARAEGEGEDTSRGTWIADDGNKLKTVSCFDNADSGLTHSEEIGTYDSIGLVWTAPDGLTKNVTFKVTVVNEKNKYWVGKQSDPIIFKDDCAQEQYTPPNYKYEPFDDDDDDAASASLVVMPLLIVCVILAIFVRN